MTPSPILLALAWVLGTLVLVTACLYVARAFGSSAIVSMYAALYVMSSVLANKMMVFAWWVVPAGTIVFSITFLLTDMLSEFYGKSVARRAVWLGLLSQVILIFTITIAINWKPASFWEGQDAFAATLGNTWRISLASLCAYLASQHHDVWAFHLLKRLTRDRHLWLRNNLSTIVSQTIDSVIFVTIAFWGIAPIIDLILGVLGAKIIIAILDTPFLYLSRWMVARFGGLSDASAAARP